MDFRTLTSHLFKVGRGAAVVALFFGVVYGPVWAMSVKFAAETLFQRNSVRLDGEQRAKLEQIRCSFGNYQLELALMVGHASADESDPDALSERRAQSVVQWFADHTNWKPRLHAESKAASQPMADPRFEFTRHLNRRVEIDVIAGPPFQVPPGPADCTPPWQSALLADPATAPTVAKALVASGDFLADAPFRAALDAKRLDIFDALVARSGIVLNTEQRGIVAMKALTQGRIDYFALWATTDGRAAIPAMGDALLNRVCNSGASVADRVQLIDVLRDGGARVASAGTMRCVLNGDVSPMVLDALVRAGGKPFVDADLLVASGPWPPMTEALLALGLEPTMRTTQGASLFHSVRLDSPATVQRLLDWGLDINARAKASDSYRSVSDEAVTPLHLAQRGCATTVLDYMKAHGANVADAGPLDVHSGDVAVQRWFVENGIPVTNSNIVDLARNRKILPVFEALLARGIHLDVANASGDTALGRAMDNYDVALVRFLVQRAQVGLGPSRNYRGDNFESALARAQGLTSLVYPPVHADGYRPNPPAAPTPSAQLQAQKEEIIAIIEGATRP